MSSYTLCAHADMTERLNDSATIILSPDSFLKTHTNAIPVHSFTFLLYRCILMYCIHSFYVTF